MKNVKINMDKIQIETKGLILNGDFQNWNIYVENLDNSEGAYLILLTSPDNTKGYDDWVENGDTLIQYFNEAKWEIQWSVKYMQKNIETKWNDLWPIVNILNEVCNGFYIKDIQKQVGFTFEPILGLLKKLAAYDVKEYETEKTIILELSDAEIEIIKNCFPVVAKELEEWEFPIRIGMLIEEASTLINKLNESFEKST